MGRAPAGVVLWGQKKVHTLPAPKMTQKEALPGTDCSHFLSVVILHCGSKQRSSNRLGLNPVPAAGCQGLHNLAAPQFPHLATEMNGVSLLDVDDIQLRSACREPVTHRRSAARANGCFQLERPLVGLLCLSPILNSQDIIRQKSVSS